MTTNELLEQHHDRITKIIQYQAGYLASMPVFAAEDPEDLSQELWLKFLVQAKRYDPSRGEFGAFASRVIRNLARYTARKAIKSRKQYPETLSLSDLVKNDGETIERSETIASFEDEEETRELRHDLQVVIAKLPSELQTLCALLAENPSLSERALARATSRTRTLVSVQLQEIRAHFSRHGMHEYLKA